MYNCTQNNFVYLNLWSLSISFPGSSTACVVALHKEERTMYTANLGDSGFLLIRDGEVVHRSVEQQHYFNTPFQLGVPPPEQEGFVLNDRYRYLYQHKLRSIG